MSKESAHTPLLSLFRGMGSQDRPDHDDPNFAPPPGRDRKAYLEECSRRWHGECLRDVRRNWSLFERHYADLVEILKPYLRDPCCEDLGGKMHNPAGTLTAWLWLNSEQEPWIFDFCEHYQRCHLRRGLIPYVKQVISEINPGTLNPRH
jgi:hypothetical protein